MNDSQVCAYPSYFLKKTRPRHEAPSIKAAHIVPLEGKIEMGGQIPAKRDSPIRMQPQEQEMLG
jgi:hypothetical protein